MNAMRIDKIEIGGLVTALNVVLMATWLAGAIWLERIPNHVIRVSAGEYLTPKVSFLTVAPWGLDELRNRGDVIAPDFFWPTCRAIRTVAGVLLVGLMLFVQQAAIRSARLGKASENPAALWGMSVFYQIAVHSYEFGQLYNSIQALLAPMPLRTEFPPRIFPERYGGAILIFLVIVMYQHLRQHCSTPVKGRNALFLLRVSSVLFISLSTLLFAAFAFAGGIQIRVLSAVVPPMRYANVALEDVLDRIPTRYYVFSLRPTGAISDLVTLAMACYLFAGALLIYRSSRPGHE